MGHRTSSTLRIEMHVPTCSVDGAGLGGVSVGRPLGINSSGIFSTLTTHQGSGHHGIEGIPVLTVPETAKNCTPYPHKGSSWPMKGVSCR